MTDETKAPAPWEKAPEASQPPVAQAQPPVTPAPEAGPAAVPTQLGAAKAPNPITDTEVAPEDKPEEVIEKVTVTVPKAFKLRVDHHHVYEIKAGVQSMRKDLAESWYAKANGVTIYQPE